ALDVDLPLEDLGEFLGDGQAQARSGVAAGVAALELAELLEDDREVLGGDAGAGVDDADADAVLGLGPLAGAADEALDAEGDAGGAAGGVADGVAGGFDGAGEGLV